MSLKSSVRDNFLCVFVCVARQIGVAYITATSTALATAVGLNLYTKVPSPSANQSQTS